MKIIEVRSPIDHGMIRDRRAQSAVWGLLTILILIVMAAGLVDIYRLYSVRNWAYAVAQEAAMTGASRGRDWSTVMSSGEIHLNSDTARREADQIVHIEMNNCAISNYQVDIRVLPDPGGGEITNFPPAPVRLGMERGGWSSSQPAVGVYLSLPVDWLILDSLGIARKSVSVFASAGVAQ
jgi:hypothetical protein